jgi:hypothetical protein
VACLDALERRVRALELGRVEDRAHASAEWAKIDKRISVEMAKVRTAIWIVGVVWALFVYWRG